MNKYIAIMAGGVGSRFWPSSTNERPKQFLDILGVGKSLIRMTFERALKLVHADHVFIVTNKKYKALVMEHLPELPKENILCEPSMNNTAPCIAYTALRINALDPNAVFAVLPSDHVILKEEEYVSKLSQAFDFATSHEAIVTLGIQPTRPDTGYGYINYQKETIGNEQIHKVISFKEKPDLATAETYLESGDYLWNAGMFVWSVPTILKSYKINAPQILDVLMQQNALYGTSDEQAYIDAVYPDTQKISVDYAILERADNVYTIPADIGWSDLGTWNSLHAYMSDGNDAVSVGQNIHLIDAKDIIVISNNDKQIVIKGLKDYIVVDEENALLIYPKSDEQEIKGVVQKFVL
ncbi:MAG TPA: mannose-1-phosphate guanylyltransferase [Saprospiraceae bacterium]|nr:mannose-1-phosphate guanylyltransferase [Saprospiraceae bacterium]